MLLAFVASVAAAWPWADRPSFADTEQSAAPSPPNEYTVKAVFLYSFGRYVEWPKAALGDDKAPFVIGVLGEDPFGGALDAIAAKKTIQDRRIVVRRFPTLEAYEKSKRTCHILFVSGAIPAEQQAAVIAKTDGKPVLVVGEAPGFSERGATADFVLDGDRVQFEINVDAARRAQLRMDAKLLRLGKPVGAPPAGTAN